MKSFDPTNFSPRAVNKITVYGNKITLTGSSGTASIKINGILNTTNVSYSSSLTATATTWCAANYDYFRVRGFLVTAASGVITVLPAHSWDTVNRINATITNLTGNLNGTLSGTFILDGSKAKVWEVTFTVPTATISPVIGLKDKEAVRVILHSIGGTTVTFNSKVVTGAGTTLVMAEGTPQYFEAFYDASSDKLIEQFNSIITGQIADGAVTAEKLASTLDLSTKTINYPAESVTAGDLAASLDLTGKDVFTVVRSGPPVAAVAAAGLLTLTGEVKDGETITVGTEVFEIDTDSTVVEGNIAIDVSANAVAAVGTITINGTPVEDQTLTIGSHVYVFKASRTGAHEITISAVNATQVTNIIAAVTLDQNGTISPERVVATAGAGTTVVITAFTPGSVANDYDFTDNATGVGCDGAGKLGGTTPGSDCNAANADDVIVTDVTAGSALVVATQGSGTTVLFTALVAGVSGNAIAFADTLSAGAVDAALLGTAVAGVDGTVSAAGEILVSGKSIWKASAPNTISDSSNWTQLGYDRVVKKTIGGVGVAGCDFNFTSAANQNEQVIDLGEIIPPLARIKDCFSKTNNVFTGAISLVAEVGTTSSGHEIINSATVYAANAILAMAADHVMTIVPSISAGHVYVAFTPGANWSLVTAGKLTIYIIYTDVTDV